MLFQNRYLYKGRVILLLNRYKHSHDVAKQVGSALWHAVEENGLFQRSLLEIPVQFVQVITLCNDSKLSLKTQLPVIHLLVCREI